MARILTTDDERFALLERTRTIAVVGVSADPRRPSHDVTANLLRSAQHDVYLVNPTETEILGQPVHPSLAALPVVPDLVDVFRRPVYLRGVVDEAIAVGASAVWFQLGLTDDDAAAAAVAAGLDVVQNRCLKIDHARWTQRGP